MANNGLGAPVVVVGGTINPSDELISGGGINGTSPRIRVDVGEPSFFDGRQFRTFKELNIAIGATYVVKAVIPSVNIILYGLETVIDAGQLRVTTLVGGTEGGTFSETLPIFNRNNMSERPTPLYTPTVVLTAGGTHTGGTALDVLRVKASNDTAKGVSVGAESGDESGVAAGTYYFRLQNLDLGNAVTGTFKARWEERLA